MQHLSQVRRHIEFTVEENETVRGMWCYHIISQLTVFKSQYLSVVFLFLLMRQLNNKQ